jgi:hypothetical protein
VTDRARRSAIAAFVQPEHRGLILQELGKDGSRANALLFDAPNSIGNAAKQDSAAPVVVSTLLGGSDYRTSICFCRGKRCNWTDLLPKNLGYRPAGQPEVCAPLTMSSEQPWLDARYILGRPYEELFSERVADHRQEEAK